MATPKRIYEAVFENGSATKREYWVQRQSLAAAAESAAYMHKRDPLRLPNGQLVKVKLIGTIDA